MFNIFEIIIQSIIKNWVRWLKVSKLCAKKPWNVLWNISRRKVANNPVRKGLIIRVKAKILSITSSPKWRTSILMMLRKIRTSRRDGGLNKKMRNLNNSLINMEPEIGNALLDSFNKGLTSSVFIDGKRFSTLNS